MSATFGEVPDDDLHPSHDRLFKAGFGDPANAAAFLSSELPPALSAHIDWAQLRLERGSFVDSHLRASESDLLFSAPLAGSECLIHLLFEHQTSRDPLLPLRLLRYLVRIWEAHAKNRPAAARLPPIVPVVLAQNAEVWGEQTSFANLLAIPADLADGIAPFVPDFRYLLIQLAEMPPLTMRGTPAGILILRAMRAERLGQLLGDDVWDEALLAEVSTEFMSLLLRYVATAGIDKQAFARRISSIRDSQTRKHAMNIAQQYWLEGRQEGRREGALASLRTSIEEILVLRFETAPGSVREALTACLDEEQLRNLHRVSIQCPTLADFEARL